MSIRNTGIWVLGALVLALGGGCKKSGPEGGAGSNQARQNTPAAMIHWVGMGRLATETNAAGFLRIWGLAETERLKAQTLDKLALAPWGAPSTNRSLALTNYQHLVRANHPASLLRTVLEDLVQVECYLEVGGATPQSGQLALAVRLKPARAGIWETNLGAVFESLLAAHRTPLQAGAARGWEIHAGSSGTQLPAMARHAEFLQSGQWTIVGLAPDKNEVFAQVLGRVQKNQEPFSSPNTNDWLQTALDLPRLSAIFSWGWDLPANWPQITLVCNGDGKNVVTRGNLSFPKPLPEIEPWIIPTNLFHEPMHSFTAVQGLKPWLASWPRWQKLHAGDPPNQLFCWSQAGSPFLDYAAAPLADAGSAMAKIGPAILEDFNPVLASNRAGAWERAVNTDGLVWNRVPIISPFIHSAKLPQGQFLVAGLSPLSITNAAVPSGTLRALLAAQNVVYFEREISGPRNEAWLYLSQLFRIIFRRNQLSADSCALRWLKICGPLLGSSATTVTKTGPTVLALTRTSTLGFTAPELGLLADWLESGDFPFQLHSVVSKLPPLVRRK